MAAKIRRLDTGEVGYLPFNKKPAAISPAKSNKPAVPKVIKPNVIELMLSGQVGSGTQSPTTPAKNKKSKGARADNLLSFCGMCKIYFSSAEKLELHNTMTHSHSQDTPAVPDELPCDLCDLTFFKIDELMTHRDEHDPTKREGNPHKCHLCDQENESKEAFREHIARNHIITADPSFHSKLKFKPIRPAALLQRPADVEIPVNVNDFVTIREGGCYVEEVNDLRLDISQYQGGGGAPPPPFHHTPIVYQAQTLTQTLPALNVSKVLQPAATVQLGHQVNRIGETSIMRTAKPAGQSAQQTTQRQSAQQTTQQTAQQTTQQTTQQSAQQRQNISKTLRALKALKAAGAKTANAGAKAANSGSMTANAGAKATNSGSKTASAANAVPKIAPRAFQALQSLKAKANAEARAGSAVAQPKPSFTAQNFQQVETIEVEDGDGGGAPADEPTHTVDLTTEPAETVEPAQAAEPVRATAAVAAAGPSAPIPVGQIQQVQATKPQALAGIQGKPVRRLMKGPDGKILLVPYTPKGTASPPVTSVQTITVPVTTLDPANSEDKGLNMPILL